MPPPRIPHHTSPFFARCPCLHPTASFETYLSSQSLRFNPSQHFSTSSPRYPRDNNRLRGVSPLRRTGPRQPLSVHKEPLPKPVLDPAKRSQVEVDPDHGLWGFFNKDRAAMSPPVEHTNHGQHFRGLARTVSSYYHRQSLDRRGTAEKILGGLAQTMVGLRKRA